MNNTILKVRGLAALCAMLWTCCAGAAGGSATPAPELGEVTVYTAGKFITMEPALPEASAVAVAGGRIVAVGEPQDLQVWIDRHGGRVDRTLEGKIVMPGFIDPHVHPSLPAVLTQFPFLAPDDWTLPTGEFPGARTPQDYETALKALVARHDDEDVPFISWGYHPLWHGEMSRQILNRWFPDQPVLLWHRSFHELIGNDAVFEQLGITGEGLADNPEIDWEKGHFWENGLFALVDKLGYLFEPQRYGQGMRNFLQMLHMGGVTTALDMGVGLFGDAPTEIALIRQVAESTQAPSRITLTPIITHFLHRGLTPAQAEAEIDKWRDSNSHRVDVRRHFKLMMDGAIFSGLSQMGFPGYLDGHSGQWMAPVETTTEWAQHFWDSGYQLHAHTNGDGSAAALIDMVRTLQHNTPRADHRTALEHYAYTTEDQSRQMAALGMVVSANPYYHYMLSDVYAEKWLGPDRADQMVRLGSLERLGVPFTLHSDCPMAPLQPLVLASTATNRVTISGQLRGAEERISLDAALRAITIDAAWVIGREDEIGSLRAGKLADFTVLEQDPYKVGVAGLKDIPIWGTVFEGKLAPLR